MVWVHHSDRPTFAVQWGPTASVFFGDVCRVTSMGPSYWILQVPLSGVELITNLPLAALGMLEKLKGMLWLAAGKARVTWAWT